MIKAFENLEVWFVTGAQLLYGGETVKIVDGHSKDMVDGLNNSGIIPIKVVYKGTANSSAEVEAVMKAANNDEKCVGIITWMHTFSPAKMWIKGLQALEKPLLHFHTQYNAELPWDSIDMDFMNLNQSAHGDIEFGHICTRMRIPRKVVVGYWKSEEAQKQIATWARVAAGVADAHNVRCLMFGMNMNNVAVTDGDRVEFEQRLGYHVDYYPVSSLMEYYKKVTDAEADALVAIMFSLVYLVLPLQIEGIADHRLLVVLRGNCGSFAAEVVDTQVLSLLSGYRTKIVGFYASLCIVLVLLDMVDGVFLRGVEAQAFFVDRSVKRWY